MYEIYRYRLLDGTDRKRADLGAINDATLVSAVDATGLYPGIPEVTRAVRAKDEHPTHGRDYTTLALCDESQRLQVSAGELADVGERLGIRRPRPALMSCSELSDQPHVAELVDHAPAGAVLLGA